MEIKGVAHCFFEQSGTFKNEFIKLGIPAYDYDIQNNFGQTDYVMDLFAEIEKAYGGGASVFDSITCDDLIMAFFPCIYFDSMSQTAFSWGYRNYQKLCTKEKTDAILKRSENREYFFRVAVQMFAVCAMKNIRLIMENPWAMQTFLKANFIMPPSLIDTDRNKRGDLFKKPTAYWFLNCSPTNGTTLEQKCKPINVTSTSHKRGGGICSEKRSMISPDYARNFICDFILGKEQIGSQLTMFE